jgi:hypothetical protein
MSAPLSSKDATKYLLSPNFNIDALRNLEAESLALSELLNRVVEDLTRQIQLDPQFDVQSIIDAFLSNERDQAYERTQFRAAVVSLLRVTPRQSRRLLQANAYRFFELFDRASEMYRDARWQLIHARAYCAASHGTGEIRGMNG